MEFRIWRASFTPGALTTTFLPWTLTSAPETPRPLMRSFKIVTTSLSWACVAGVAGL